MSYVIAGYVAVLGVLGLYAARLVLRSREAASRLTQGKVALGVAEPTIGEEQQ